MSTTEEPPAIAPAHQGGLPTWDVSSYFPSLHSVEFLAAEERLGADLERLRALYNQHDVRTGEPLAHAPALVEVFEQVLDATNRAFQDAGLLRSFCHAFISTDATDDTAQAAVSRLASQSSSLEILKTRFDAWVARLDLDALVGASDTAAGHDWPLRKSSLRAQRQMSEPEEELASVLSLTGSTAWSQLWSDVTAGIMAPVDLPQRTVELPIFAIRSMASDPDPVVRRAAYVAELEAWETHATPLAAAMNAIKGEQLRLTERRGWPSVIDAQLFGQGVDRPALDALQAAMVGSLPDFRRYFRAKAGLLGHDGPLPWWELFAPVGAEQPRTWDEATQAVEEAFASYSPQLRGLAQRAFAQRWVDAGSRGGKQGGAFCMPMGDGDSRILMNFNDSVDGFMTLAHELGHAYHNTTMAERSPLQRGTPSSLAETASIFCETIMVEHGLATITEPDQRLSLLDVDLQGSAQIIVDIHSRFLFEASVFEERARSSISTSRLCELMATAQEASYGDALHETHRHQWMWAAKPHYYGSVFYNWPYAFGLLFGLGLYARYGEDPDGFRSGYDDLLSSTGLADATTLAARFGIALDDQAFWEASLDVIRARIDTYCALAEASGGQPT